MHNRNETKTHSAPGAEKIIHIDRLSDELQALEIYSTMSYKQLRQAYEQAEKDGRINDAEKLQPSSIMERLIKLLRDFKPEEHPEMLSNIYKTTSRLCENIFAPYLTVVTGDALKDLLYTQGDQQAKQELLNKITEALEHLKQDFLIMEDIGKIN